MATPNPATPPPARSESNQRNEGLALNQLLRGEIAAVETYNQALGKFLGPNDWPITSSLTRIRNEHLNAVEWLRNRVAACGVEPAEGAGVWGAFAQTVTGTAKVIGPQTLLAALKQGELYGFEEIRKVVSNQEVSRENRSEIRNDLLLQTQEHILVIDELQAQIQQ